MLEERKKDAQWIGRVPLASRFKKWWRELEHGILGGPTIITVTER
jgi:hypothetical protein